MGRGSIPPHDPSLFIIRPSPGVTVLAPERLVCQGLGVTVLAPEGLVCLGLGVTVFAPEGVMFPSPGITVLAPVRRLHIRN